MTGENLKPHNSFEYFSTVGAMSFAINNDDDSNDKTLSFDDTLFSLDVGYPCHTLTNIFAIAQNKSFSYHLK